MAVMAFNLVYFSIKKVVPLGVNLFNTIITFLFVVIWTYILRFLCNRVSTMLVWTLVIINFILVSVSFVYINAGLKSGDVTAKDIFMFSGSGATAATDVSGGTKLA